MRPIIGLLNATLLLTAALAASAPAQDDPFALEAALQQRSPTEAALLSDVREIAPGQPFTAALKLVHPEGWHSYYINPGALGASLSSSWTLPEGFTAERLAWPTPHLGKMLGENTFGYEGTVYHLFQITPPKSLNIGSTYEFELKANWQICDESNCVFEPGPSPAAMASFKLDLRAAETPVPDPANTAAFAEARAMQPSPLPEDWKLEASDDGQVISILISAGSPIGTDHLYFFDEDRQLDAQAKVSVEESDQGVRLSIPRNKGGEFTEPGPTLDHLKGVLTVEDDAYNVKVALSGSGSGEGTTAKLDKESPSLLKILGLAFLGGIILNLMPCVFPVLGLKIMGFVEQAGEDPKKIKKHGLVFAAGLLASLWIVAGILIGLIVSGQHLGWGFQLNDSRFLAAMIVLLFVLGLNLVGVFEIGTSLTGVGSNLQHKKGYSGSFFTGVLTTLVATPCTGPFLGVAMGFALQQPAYISLIVFTALGLGIAFPYVLLSYNPKLLKKLPRPGAWMETMKKALAFPLFLWVVYLLNGFGAQTGRGGIVWLLTALVIIAIACWIYGHWDTPVRAKRVRLIGRVATLLIFGMGVYVTSYALDKTPEGAESDVAKLGELEAVKWAPGIVTDLQAKGHIVFVDYTADT